MVKIIYNDKFLRLFSVFMHVEGITLYPFIILRKRFKNSLGNKVVKNHEMIHIKQQIELLVVGFYFLYILEYLIRLILYQDTEKAYKSISFEKEAYKFENDFNYIKKRPIWGWFKFL